MCPWPSLFVLAQHGVQIPGNILYLFRAHRQSYEARRNPRRLPLFVCVVRVDQGSRIGYEGFHSAQTDGQNAHPCTPYGPVCGFVAPLSSKEIMPPKFLRQGLTQPVDVFPIEARLGTGLGQESPGPQLGLFCSLKP
jgi:hypothetical protein